MTGCNSNRPNEKSVIMFKSYLNWNDKPLPKCICRFAYVNKDAKAISFQDSCHKYSVGDKLIKLTTP
jgi:hypothetical protein